MFLAISHVLSACLSLEKRANSKPPVPTRTTVIAPVDGRRRSESRIEPLQSLQLTCTCTVAVESNQCEPRMKVGAFFVCLAL